MSGVVGFVILVEGRQSAHWNMKSRNPVVMGLLEYLSGLPFLGNRASALEKYI